VSWTIDTGVGDPTSFSISGSAGSQTLTLAGQPITLLAGTTRSVHITAVTTSTSCATYNNTASASATNDGSDQASASETVGCPSITLTKTADDEHVDSGDKIGFTITVDNTSQGPATDVVVTDNLPGKDGLNWSMKPVVSDCTITGPKESQVLRCTFPILPGGTSVSIHIVSTTKDDSCGTVKNTASATADGADPVTAGPVKITVSCPEEQQGNPGGENGGGGGEHTPTPTPSAPVPNPAPTPVNPPKPQIAPIRALSAAPNTGVGMGPAWGLMAVWTGLVALVGSWFGGREDEDL
jgi:uncharacterized repeat protein (TIGR01451 family)